ncbi:MAG: response regulator [Candidatus Omnitrophica bacterium]|nr:response regulator [Candidatus Omnitrophota bacterium]
MKKEKKKILVVDDDAGMVKVLEKWLHVAGREVIGALSGETGLERAEKEVPDLILLDLMLPGIGGVEVARRLKANSVTKDIPVIFITMCIGVENDKGDEKIEVDGQIYRAFAKPLHNKKLLSEIRKTINRRENS